MDTKNEQIALLDRYTVEHCAFIVQALHRAGEDGEIEETLLRLAASLPSRPENTIRYPSEKDVGVVTLPNGERWAVAGPVARYVDALKARGPYSVLRNVGV